MVMEVMKNQKKLMLKHLISKVMKGLPFLALMSRARQRRAYLSDDISDDDDDDVESEVVAATTVPEDVKEGHFAVIAMQGEAEETKRFIVELDYLTDPAFLKLLEQASEEYGFKQKGALAVPCRPQELLKIIENKKVDNKANS